MGTSLPAVASPGDQVDLDVVLQHAVDEAVRLIGADGGIIDLLDPDTDVLRWTYDSGIDPVLRARWANLELPPGAGIYGRALAERRVMVADEYLDESGFVRHEGADTFAAAAGVRSSMAGPLIGPSGEAFGAIGVYSRRAGAFGPQEVALLRALADHAAVAIENARAIDQLAGSTVEVARREAALRSLREVAARITAIRDPGEVLRGAVHEAARLLRADGAIVYVLDPATDMLRWTADAGIGRDGDRSWFRGLQIPFGRGMFGSAVATGQVRITGDYTTDTSFEHASAPDRVAQDLGIRSMVVAPLVGSVGPLGAVGAYATEPDAFDPADGALLRALADHAAAAITNARLIEQLDRSRRELERRADEERTLREITARITEIRDEAEVLQLIVEETRRLLGADGAHLTLLSPDGSVLIPEVVAGHADEETRRWLHSLEFELDGGMNGLAATTGEATRTSDYRIDPRVPHGPADRSVAERLGLRGMAVAPLHGDGGVIGTLAISYERPRFVTDAEVELLQSLADQAAIAVANARLYEELRRSEERYRFLLERSPDAAWSCDADGRFQFMADSITRLAGWRSEELVGRHFSMLVDPAWLATAEAAWGALVRDPQRPQRLRFDLLHKDGTPVPIEIHAAATIEDGRFAGAHGSVRDVTGRDRVERDLLRQATELAGTQERAHLARELHDSVTQALFSMTLTTRSAELLLDRDPAAAHGKLQELRELERDALAEMRGLLFELRPRSLEQDGLVQAVRTHAAAVQGRSGLSVVVEADPIDRVSIAVEDALFRIAQEALHNVVKHAGASQVTVRIRGESDGIRLEVADDGHGFDPARVPSGHLGLAGMRARAQQVGGRLEVRSSGQGTVLTVRAPLRGGPVAEGQAPVRTMLPVGTTDALFPPLPER